MTRNNEKDPKFAGARIMKQYLDFAKGKSYETVPKLVFSADGDKNIKKLKDQLSTYPHKSLNLSYTYI